LNGKIASCAQAELWFVSWALECPGRCHSSREACDVFQKALNKEPAALQMIGLSGIGFAPDLALALRALTQALPPAANTRKPCTRSAPATAWATKNCRLNTMPSSWP